MAQHPIGSDDPMDARTERLKAPANTDLPARPVAESAGTLLNLILAATNDGVMDWDLITGTISYSERWKSLLGFENHELVDSPSLWRELSHPDDLAETEALLRDHVDNLWPLSHTWRMRHKNDDWRWFLGRAVTLQDGKSVPLRCICVFTDVTDQVLAEQQHMQGQKLEALGQLAAGIAHEINAPMQDIANNVFFLGKALTDLLALLGEYQGAVETLKLAIDNPDLLDRLQEAEATADIDYMKSQLPRAIDSTQDGIGRVRKIVYAMKEFAHPGRSEKAPEDINRAIECTATISANTWKHVATLEMKLAPDLPKVDCYLGEINQVVLNLIVNAAHAIGDLRGENSSALLGEIVIETAVKDGFAEIRISDTGGGIPEEIRHRLFEPFFTTKEVGRGTGQGLTLARSMITEHHGGTLTFVTEVGKGTTFTVGLPLASPQ